MHQCLACRVCAFVSLGVASTAALAQSYQVQTLNRGPFGASIGAYDGIGTTVVGRGRRSGEGPRPVIWEGYNAVPFEVPMGGWYMAEDTQLSGRRVAASVKATSSSDSKATLWSDYTASPLSIHPVGYSWSRVNEFNGDQIAGVGYPSTGWYHAALWSGITGQFTNLHATQLNGQAVGGTIAQSTDGISQVGWASLDVAPNYPFRAVRWEGTAASIVSLHVAGWLNSYAWGVSGNQAVGSVWNLNASEEHAMLWEGTTPKNLHPVSGWFSTKATGVGPGWQAGWGTKTSGGTIYPLVWRGTPESMEVLSTTSGQVYGSDQAGNLYGQLGGQAVVWVATVVTVAGQVTLEDLQASMVAGSSVQVEVRAPGSATVLETKTVVLQANGAFSYSSSLSTGTYDLTFKASHWLRKKLASVGLTANHVVTLINGDVDGDNSVTVFDYDRLSTAFDSALGQAGYDRDADLDGDGTVTVFDYDTLSRNFDLVGAD